MRSGGTWNIQCSTPGCGLPISGYCQTDSLQVCGFHAGFHQGKGHVLYLRRCDLCNGYGRIRSQYAEDDPEGTGLRCPKCFGKRFVRGSARANSYSGRSNEDTDTRRGAGYTTGSGQGSGQRGGNTGREQVDVSTDYYAVLGVAPDADGETVKQAYRKLIKRVHPDLNPGSRDALEKTKALNKAYDVLSNSYRRREYDRERSTSSHRASEAGQRTREATQRAETERERREAARRAEAEQGRRGENRKSGISKCGVAIAIILLISCFSQIINEESEQDAKPSVPSTPMSSASTTPLPCNKEPDCLRQQAVQLINEDRAKHGFHAVTMGSNRAAQLHAEDMVEHGYLGHWWVDGRKPYMVYTQTGGISYVSENAGSTWASEECGGLLMWVGICGNPDPDEAVPAHQWGMMYDDAHADWGHRDNILRESHRAVNIGIAWNEKRMAFVQHFEGGAATVRSRPTLSRNGILSLELVKRERGIDIARVVSVYYDPTPTRMTVSQIGRLDSYCVGGGQTIRCGDPVIRVLRPPGVNRYYTNLDDNEVVADSWTETDSEFSFSADVSGLTQKPGVYTVTVWRDTGERLLSEKLIQLSVFVR